MFSMQVCTFFKYGILGFLYDVIDLYICSAQSKIRYNSGIVLRKVGIFTLSANSGIVPDNSRIAQGIYVENR